LIVGIATGECFENLSIPHSAPLSRHGTQHPAAVRFRWNRSHDPCLRCGARVAVASRFDSEIVESGRISWARMRFSNRLIALTATVSPSSCLRRRPRAPQGRLPDPRGCDHITGVLAGFRVGAAARW